MAGFNKYEGSLSDFIKEWKENYPYTPFELMMHALEYSMYCIKQEEFMRRVAVIDITQIPNGMTIDEVVRAWHEDNALIVNGKIVDL